MDVTQWYGVALASLATLIIALCLLAVLIRPPTLILKHVVYPQIPLFLRGNSQISRFEGFLIAVLLIGNSLCSALGTKDTVDFVRRTARMSMLNILPLFLGGRINAVAGVSGINYENFARIHRWLGRIAIIECTVHAAIAGASQRVFRSQSQIFGLLAASCMIAIQITSLQAIRQHFYEPFAKLHQLLAPLVVISIWLHVPFHGYTNPPVVYLLAAALLYGAILVINIIHTLFRNAIRLSDVEIRTINGSTDAVRLEIALSRPWPMKGGQFVYLRFLTTQQLAFLQSHPFYITSIDGNIASLIVERKSGFTSTLLHQGMSTNPSSPPYTGANLKAIVHGPFSQNLRLESYGTVILFATGVGIAAQLSYIRQLLEGRQAGRVKAVRITLIWEIESEVHKYWVRYAMDDIMSLDVDFRFNVHVFIKGNFTSPNRVYGAEYAPKANQGRPNRLSYHYYELDAKARAGEELAKAKGKTIIAVCTDNRTADHVREVVCRELNENITFQVLDFQVERPYDSFSRLDTVMKYVRYRNRREEAGIHR